MAILDIKLNETGDGGDIVLNGNDIEVIHGFQNMPYIGMFGGQLKEATTNKRVQLQVFDYWGNKLFEPSNKKAWFNARLENLLDNIELTSRTIPVIQNQIYSDLDFMTEFSNLEVTVKMVGLDKLLILIEIAHPDLSQKKEFRYIWNAIESELEEDNGIDENEDEVKGLDYSLDFNLP